MAQKWKDLIKIKGNIVVSQSVSVEEFLEETGQGPSAVAALEYLDLHTNPVDDKNHYEWGAALHMAIRDFDARLKRIEDLLCLKPEMKP